MTGPRECRRRLASPTNLRRRQPVALASPEDKAKAFIASFDGGECFLIKPLPGATKPHEYQAVGRTIEPFLRFDSACKREVGAEANLTMAPITAEQCPALDLVRLAAGRATAARLRLRNYEVGPGQPFLGTISGLERRPLYLILVDNDGLARRLEAKVDPSHDSAAFSVPLTPTQAPSDRCRCCSPSSPKSRFTFLTLFTRRT
jgi:eukaryotic-like serine/threonine-protein kinase